MKNILLCSLVALSVVGTGCISVDRSRNKQRRSSTIDFLYPKGKFQTGQPSIPHLNLPLSVGIAFVPEASGRHDSRGPSEERKTKMLETVAEKFQSQPFIKKIEIIPTAYLKPGGGFANLEQVRTMLGIDVIALVAYDQLQHSDANWASLSYLTVVGAFVVSGDTDETSTMLDTTVFHIPSRKLLFRAPGTSRIKGLGARVYRDKRLRADGLQGMDEANTAMIANLDRELTRFKKRVKEQPKEFRVTHAPGYQGGGNLGIFGALLGLLVIAGGRRKSEDAE